MDKEKLQALIDQELKVALVYRGALPSRTVCVADSHDATSEELFKENGIESPPAANYCPTLLNTITSQQGAEGIMALYERRALQQGLTLDGPPKVGAAGHLLHMLHRSLSQADVRDVAGKPGVVEMTFQKADGKTFTVEVTEEMAFDIGYTAALFNLSNPTPATYFHFDPGMQGAGEPIRNFAQQLSPQKSEAELLALAAQCFDKGQNHGALACAAAGEMFASHSFGLPSPVTTTASLKTDDKPAPARN